MLETFRKGGAEDEALSQRYRDGMRTLPFPKQDQIPFMSLLSNLIISCKEYKNAVAPSYAAIPLVDSL